MADPVTCGLVLLAAGASRRMGEPKQLLSVGGQPLLRRVAEAGVASGVGAVVVVLGANAEEIRPCLAGLPVHVVINDGWAEGMGSSVRTGMKALDSLAIHADGVVIALTDQPGFSASHVTRLLMAHRETGKAIVASQCGGKQLPPVFFASRYFPALRILQGDAGARSLLQTHSDDVAIVKAVELGDLDTPDDYALYLKQKPEAGLAPK